MEIKVCPNCGAHNKPNAMRCGNHACQHPISDVPVVEMSFHDVKLVKELASDRPWDNKFGTKSTSQVLLPSCLVLVISCCVLSNIIGLIAGIESSNNYGPGLALFIPIFTFFALFTAGIIWAFGWLWIWPFIDCLRNESSIGNEKILWALIIFFLHALGGILYLAIRRSHRIEMYGH